MTPKVRSVVSFYRLPADVVEKPYEAVWAFVESEPSVQTIGSETSQLEPQNLATKVARSLADPKDHFHYMIEDYAEEGCNYLFVSATDGKPVWGCAI